MAACQSFVHDFFKKVFFGRTRISIPSKHRTKKKVKFKILRIRNCPNPQNIKKRPNLD